MVKGKRAKPADEVQKWIEGARREGATVLDLVGMDLTELPDAIGDLVHLEMLHLGGNRLSSLPEWFSQLSNLERLNLSGNAFRTIPEPVLRLPRLEQLYIEGNPGLQIPDGIGRLSTLRVFAPHLDGDSVLPSTLLDLPHLSQLWLSGDGAIPPWIAELKFLTELRISERTTEVPAFLGDLAELRSLVIHGAALDAIPPWISRLTKLERLQLFSCGLTAIPDWISELTRLVQLDVSFNALVTLPKSIGQLASLERLGASFNKIETLPATIGRLEKVQGIELHRNPLASALQSAYDQGLDALKAYLRSLDNAEPLYEAKLVLVGEGDVGKTTLLKALSGKEPPREGEPTTHGISIDIQSMHLPHPEKAGVGIQFNAWDFGGQEVYRATHQFFFSRRSVYLLVWEPRMGVQQCQVEDWLKLIRVRVGDDARVIVVSTHAKTGQRIARIDKPVLEREYGSMIAGFIEVDSLQDFQIAELKGLIAGVAKDLEHMGMPFNVQWKEARDAALVLGKEQPRVAYAAFAALCGKYGLDALDTRTLAGLMHDLGYIVYYGDDERLKDDVILQPEWLTKAIGFVLEDRQTQEQDGILRDDHLIDVWLKHRFENEPRYPVELYPFFLRLMEKYDVSYRLETGDASLVAQHVPQVRSNLLPWLPGDEPRPERRRLTMVCVLDETPAGLIPWLIVRTHPYAMERDGHRLHWQKGMFLRNNPHGEAYVELRDRELHLQAEAVWPVFFMNVLMQTVEKLITDNWPGLQGRYTFAVPCPTALNGKSCQGRFNVEALRVFLADGDPHTRCQFCLARHKIVDLLFGLDDEEPRQQLARIEAKIDHGVAGIQSQIANSVMVLMKAMANEAKEGPRLFDLGPVDGNWRRLFAEKYTLRLWCEAENAQHPLLDGLGSYELELTREWVRQVAPYAVLVVALLKTILPMVAPAVNVAYGANTFENLGVKDHVDLMEKLVGRTEDGLHVFDTALPRGGVLTGPERHGLLALHSLLRQLDPNHAKLGLHRVSTYTGDYQWLCRTHYDLSQPKIPDRILPVQ